MIVCGITIAAAIVLGGVTGVFSRVPNSRKTKGTIIGLKRANIPSDDLPRYKAIIEYGVNGQSYRVESKRRSYSYKVGKQVTVAYDETNPSNALIRPSKDTYIFMGLWVVAGLFLSLLIKF